jgi:LacI family transcriptional regulator
MRLQIGSNYPYIYFDFSNNSVGVPSMALRDRNRLQVALLIETSTRYGRDLLHGVHDWLRSSKGKWSIRLTEQIRGAAPPGWLRAWAGDGIIARVDNGKIARALRHAQLPVVDVSAERFVSEFPRVSIDNAAVARLAVAHLREKQLRHFAYCGDPRHLWSKLRGRAFVRELRATGLFCAEFLPPLKPSGGWEQEINTLVAWLVSLPKPIGLFACYDARAHQVIEACHRANLAVPEDVAVLGVDDDELICEMCDPPLSSVLPNARRTGYEAADILARLMSGQKVRLATTREIEPVRVVERRSTDAIAIADLHVAAALRYIREHAHGGTRVKEVLRAVPVSRTLLEKKFQQHLGESPHRIIKRQQIERVRQLLVDSDLPIARIADTAGFESASYLSAAFRRETGESPREHRARSRPR